MVLVKDVTDDLRADLDHGQVDLGEEIYVAAFRVGTAIGKTLLRELADPGETRGDGVGEAI